MLELENIDVFYENIQALKQVTLLVRKGEMVAVIGANGAGKTTTLRTISGLIRPKKGKVSFNGKSIDRKSVEEIVTLGISHVPEGRRIFPGLTVMENLALATAAWRKGRMDIEGDLEKVFRLFPRLREREKQLGWSLSGGEQQMLAIGRALMARPTLLLLDEPSLGLAPVLVQELFVTIEKINKQGTTILLVEQNAFMALEVAQRVYVMENGEIVVADTVENLTDNSLVKEAYLGG